VRAGYSYFPQLKTLVAPSTVYNAAQIPDVHADYTGNAVDPLSNTQPKGWDVVVPIKESEVDVKRSMVTDLMHTYNDIPHKNKTAAGMNAGFPDGHVSWQGANSNPQAFDNNGASSEWQAFSVQTGAPGNAAYRTIISWFKP
jgi:prepilin-type processing-associated H-X9-DG protein